MKFDGIHSVKIISTMAFVLFAFSCVSQKNSKTLNYHEDLSSVRPVYDVNLDSLLIDSGAVSSDITVEHDQNAVFTKVFDSIVVLNKNIKYIRGYKVMVYSGGSQDDALNVRREVMDALIKGGFDRAMDEVQFDYHQPVFRIKVGKYTSRLEAVRVTEFLKAQQYDFGEDSKIMVNPLVVPDKIEIR